MADSLPSTDGAVVRALYQRGRAAHPDIDLDQASFARHLAACGAPVADAAAAGGLHAEDLYLCAAALAGDAAAAAILRRLHRPVVARYLRNVDGSPAFVDEVEQRLWSASLLPTPDGPPKLASYAGRGPLAGWVGVSAQRIALSLMRHEQAEQRAAEGQRREAERVAADPELGFLKQHLRERFRQAVTGALAVLDDHQRLIYRMYVVDGVPMDRIGKMYGVTSSTISRRMSAARASVVAEAQRLLREDMGVAPEEYESMARLLVSQLDLSVSRVLGKGA
ncbi:MAG TPA: sigma factor-like helix-turn-helix DNA-binding protein [Polyangia bacterium]|nr:sigma factor-like helix-turn-helix DNA-binding protein [Polyangia bacterium]